MNKNKGITLVELLLVIAIMSIITGITAVGISLIYSRDAEKCAKLIDTALEEVRMSSLSREGSFRLAVDGVNHILTVEALSSGTTEEKALPKKVEISVYAEGDSSKTEGKSITVEFDKAAGKIKEIKIDGTTVGRDSYHTVRISAETKSNSKKASVMLIKMTGKHYVEYNG